MLFSGTCTKLLPYQLLVHNTADQGRERACRSATVSTQVGPSADTCTCSSRSRAPCWNGSPGRASTCDCPTCAHSNYSEVNSCGMQLCSCSPSYP